MFIRNESFYSFRKNYPVITVLVGIHLILFLWTSFFPFGREIYLLGRGSNFEIITGEYWRLLTPIFLHGGLMHVVFNSFSLVIFGPVVEKILGKIKFISIYLLSGILANIATLYLGGVYYLHVGASGAIFGIFGVLAYMIWARRDLIDRANSQLVVTIIIIALVMTFVNPGINIFAHLFGFIAGMALAPLFLIGAKPFVQNYHRRDVYDNDEPSFNPNRWANQEKKKQKKKILWISIAVVAVILMVIRFFE
ncbi:rhomboid family intramembrane serine protease [Alkalicoccobacillus plakortidis]|uniref:Rhomboid family intramembrane serine protease n=1 Tax=Alkalicoccobacillus plakortidis TaxID=444060 RepID=A0ABT0XMA6_9BACI|nr:rhomboid family intramembrane serine protease [Alkalicoccobacillus plakortidis]MCM2677043.1 rhomboid family intramembrane serine protease [Alkalicoccobacillus plakortidis]